MQFSKFVAVATLAVFAACGGGDQAAETTADSMATVAAEAPAAPATATEVTGTTHVVQMLGDEKGYRFEPANITIKTGDAIRFEMVSGGPHNVAFDATKLSPEAKAALIAGLPNPMAELSSQMFLNPGESVTINFANVPAGSYEYVCTPHLAMGMKGVITVQ